MGALAQGRAIRQDRRIAGVLIGAFLGYFLLPLLAAAAPPGNFDRAKILLREQVYHDQNTGGALGTLYCGCDWEWAGRSGGIIDHASCGYEVRAQQNRAARIEWEHIVPAYWIGNQRQCWQEGGRQNCVSNDPEFRVIEADMHNLSPSVGEVNADRSNHRFGMLPTTEFRHGACNFKVDFRAGVAEPRDEVKGLVARVYFYMYDRYDLRLSSQQERLLMAWDRMYPVTDWERERDRRIAAIMGHSNPFVTGERRWERGHRNSAEGLMSRAPQSGQIVASLEGSALPVIGNRNSGIYHLPVGCAGYSQVAEGNRVYFDSEQDARSAGFRRAGNCRDQPVARQDVSAEIPTRSVNAALIRVAETNAMFRNGLALPMVLAMREPGIRSGLNRLESRVSIAAAAQIQPTDT